MLRELRWPEACLPVLSPLADALEFRDGAVVSIDILEWLGVGLGDGVAVRQEPLCEAAERGERVRWRPEVVGGLVGVWVGDQEELDRLVDRFVELRKLGGEPVSRECVVRRADAEMLVSCFGVSGDLTHLSCSVPISITNWFR